MELPIHGRQHSPASHSTDEQHRRHLAMQLLPLLQQTFPHSAITGYETIQTIVQANAEGRVVQLFHCPQDDNHVLLDGADDADDADVDADAPDNDDDDDGVPPNLFIKQVQVNKYVKTKKSWSDLRRTIMYLRTECRFYQEILPQLNGGTSSSWSCQQQQQQQRQKAFPKLYAAHYNLKGLVTEDEGATGPAGPEPIESLAAILAAEEDSDHGSMAAIGAAGGYVVMEAISPDFYLQDSPISLHQAKQTLAAVASLHASAWEDTVLLKLAEERLSRGSYHLATRNPQELSGMPQAWNHFQHQFGSHEFCGGKYTSLFEKCGYMGHRIQELAEYLCQETSPTSADPFATLTHGDFKAMNCFLPKRNNNNDERGVIMVDFASTGVGLGMSDVAMHIHHAVRPNDLANGGEFMLVDFYLSTLERLLQEKQQNSKSNKTNGCDDSINSSSQESSAELYYPRDVALRHYRLAVADYFRFFLGRFWKSATPESFAKKKDSQNTALINRDVEAAMSFLERVERYVTQIEAERQTEEARIQVNDQYSL